MQRLMGRSLTVVFCYLTSVLYIMHDGHKFLHVEMSSGPLIAFVTAIKSYHLLKCCKIIHVVMDLLSCILLPTAREGNVFTGVCHSVHNRPYDYLVIAVGTHPIGMVSCSIAVVDLLFKSNIIKKISCKLTLHSFPNT